MWILCGMNAPLTDGRLLKGERRRRELIEATLRVVARDGVAGVSHRAVAREAGLSPTAAAYHFRGIGELLTAALTRCMDESAGRMRRIAERAEGGGPPSVPALARQMAELFDDPRMLLAEYELFLLAARRPELRAPTHRWLDTLADFARRHTDDPARVRVLVATVDGVLLQSLLYDTPPTAAQFEAVLRAVLTGPTARS